jgi:alpha-galactosidase
MFRLHVRLTNRGQMSQAVDWFPSWGATWQIPDGADWVRSWPALSYNRIEKQITNAQRVKLGSELQSSDISSDGQGATPYWTVGGKSARLYFGLEWCGGWSAKLQGTENGFSFLVRLPSSDTQLVLNPGDAVDGPKTIVMPATGLDDSESRRAWIAQVRVLANSVYRGVRPSFPLTYNHWYSVGFNVNADFLRRQIDWMDAYGFDAFIVDAGWYDAVGSWQPDPAKFQPGEFESILKSISDNGVKVGIWSCPQFTTAKRKRLPPEVDDPPYYEDFVGGYLLDLADSGFTDRLSSHVAMLRQRYLADWWKYDQTFFSATTRAGAMRNVIAFQDALLAVRQQNPDLAIENCQSGGRMINALTTMATQATWLSDGRLTGLLHAQQNIQLALGALDFLAPWAVYRWTNNLDQMDQSDDELTRFYCRSAMAGTWGISADLSKIPDHQQDVIRREIQNYRRLNPIKLASLYEISEPADGVDAAGVTFYDARRKRAAVMLYRWDSKAAFSQQVAVDKLRTTLSYLVTDVDTGASATISGADLLKSGVIAQFGPERMSALLFIESVN